MISFQYFFSYFFSLRYCSKSEQISAAYDSIFEKKRFKKYHILNQNSSNEILLILEHVIILVLVTSPYFALDAFAEGLTSIFSVGEFGQEIVAAAFLQKHGKNQNVTKMQNIVSFLYHYIHMKSIKICYIPLCFSFLRNFRFI